MRQATNHRKKSSLILRIKRLFRQLERWTNFAKLKPSIVASMIAVGFSFGPQAVSGQNFFAEPVAGAFGVSTIESEDTYLLISSFVDLDDDGDLDLVASGLVISYYGDTQEYFYYENKGDASVANFTGPKSNLFGLGISLGEYGRGFPGTFVDLDNDGDFDVLSSSISYNSADELNTVFLFQENIGTKEDPSFAESVTNPFNLDLGNIQTYFNSISAIDLDEDGDMDIIVNTNYDYSSQILYFENVGSGGNVSFKDPIDLGTTVFDLQSDEYSINSSFADMDNDGDQDLFMGVYDAAEDGIFISRYYENISDDEIKFKAPIDNPFNLEPAEDDVFFPELVDIDADGDFDIFSFGYVESEDYAWDLYFYENLDAPSLSLVNTESTDCTQGQTVTISVSDINVGDANVDSLSIEAITDNEDLVTNLMVEYESAESDANVSFIPASDGTGTANIMVTISDGNLSFTENYLFTVGDCLGIENVIDRSTFNIAPNPANDFLRIILEDNFITDNTFINIYDFKGKLVLQKPLNKNTIDVSDLISGMYVLEINYEDVSHYRKLVIEN